MNRSASTARKLMPLLASGFNQTDARTDESFGGFPSYWNIVVFYCYVLGFLARTVIVPIHYTVLSAVHHRRIHHIV